MAAPVGPLDGLFVLEVANWIAAPSCGALLADMGARVVKVEPNEGDSMRYTQRQPRSKDGKSQQGGQTIDHSFTLNNRGKQSVAIDLGKPEGQGLVRDLAKQADIFLTNLLPGRLAKYGLGYEQLRSSNPGLVYAAVMGWGMSGPDPDKAAYDRTAFFAQGGVTGLLGRPGQDPVMPRSGQGDHQTGLAALSSVLGALLLRQKTGKGSLCEVSLLRTATWNISEDLAPALVDGVQPKKSDAQSDSVMTRCYETQGGRWIMLCMPIREGFYFPKFAKALGHPGWVSDPRFDTPAKRYKNRVALSAEITAAFKGDTLDAWVRALNAAGCIASPIAQLGEVCSDPHLRANGAFQQVQHPAAGSFETVAAPFNIHGAAVRARGPGPEPGADTAAVLGERLGLAGDRLRELTEKGVLGFRPAKGSPLANWTAKL